MTVEEIIGKVFNVSPEGLNGLFSRNTIEAWDSMGHINLIMEIEKQYNVHVSIADAVDMVDVGKIKEILRGYGVNC